MKRRHWTVHLALEPDRDRLLIRGWRVRELAEQVGARPLWLGAVKSWSLPISYAADLVAVLEYRGAEVVVDSDPEAAPLPDHPYGGCVRRNTRTISSPEPISPKLATAVASSPAPIVQRVEQSEDVQRVAHLEDPMLPFGDETCGPSAPVWGGLTAGDLLEYDDYETGASRED